MNAIIKIMLVFFLGVTCNYAQSTISGKITDNKKQPLEFANVILYGSTSKEVITGDISSEKGVYLIEDVPNGNYFIEVSILGFKTKTSEVFQLDNSTKTINFVLDEDTLDEVLITYKRPVIKQTAEKLVVDFEKSDMINTNLQDVMKKVPGIIVINGKPNYAGQGGLRILINDKTTDYMDITSLLREMPANNIAKIELIQQPGAEFDAEGSGPIINIILKKNMKIGTHGNIRSTLGYTEDLMYGTNFSVSSYKNKLNWQASAGISKSSWREDLFITRKVLDKTYKQSSIAPEDPQRFNASISLDYFINDEQTIGINSRMLNSKSDRVTNNSTTINDVGILNTLLTNSSFNKERLNYTINPYYEFKDAKNTLTLDFSYVNYSDNNENNLFKIGESEIDYDNRRYLQDVTYKILTYKGDYKNIISDNLNWSVGSKYSQVDNESYLRSFTQNDTGFFIENIDQNNRFLIYETILGLYSKINLKIDKWNFSGGLRWEISKTKGTSVEQNEVRNRNISKLFPSANVSRKISEDIDASFAYSYRINRPSYNSLNAFVLYYDAYTFEQGNPNLKPSFANNYQFNLTNKGQPFFKISYSSIKEDLFQILLQNDSSAEISRSTINIESSKNLSFQFFVPMNFIKKIDGFSSIIVNHKQYQSKDLIPNINDSKWSLTSHTSMEFKLPYNINSEISAHYTTGGLEGQVEYKGIAGIDLAISKKLLNDRLKVTLEWEEIINSPFKGYIKYDNINADIINNWVNNNVYLQLSYNFGSKYSKGKNRRNSSKEEEDRIDNNN
jgi:hypothetical protein